MNTNTAKKKQNNRRTTLNIRENNIYKNKEPAKTRTKKVIKKYSKQGNTSQKYYSGRDRIPYRNHERGMYPPPPPKV